MIGYRKIYQEESIDASGKNTGSAEYRGLSYHIWEYADGDGPCGVETNVANVGRTRELEGNYEEQVLEILRQF